MSISVKNVELIGIINNILFICKIYICAMSTVQRSDEKSYEQNVRTGCSLAEF